jgi:hypothetical protein
MPYVAYRTEGKRSNFEHLSFSNLEISEIKVALPRIPNSPVDECKRA